MSPSNRNHSKHSSHKERRKIRLFITAVIFLLIIISVTSLALAWPLSPRLGSPEQSRRFNDNPVAYGKSPTTGLDFSGEYKPVLVQISNGPQDRPQWNLSEADIVYESIYWGPSHTRYTAVYNDVHPEMVGPVRSARIQHVMLREEWDAPFIFWGGQKDPGTDIYNLMDQYKLNRAFRWDGTGGHFLDYLTRSKGEYARPNPHNAIANIAGLVTNAWPTDHVAKSHAFRFSDTIGAGYDTAVEIDVPYLADKYNPSYKYNAATGMYDRYYNGALQVDGHTKKQIVAANVIVQRQKLMFYNGTSSRPVYEVVGEGEADIFVDGQHIRGKWIRSSMDERTVFVNQMGVEVTLKPGKTFIQIIPNTLNYTYTTAEGSKITQTYDPSRLTDDEIAETDNDDSEIDKAE